MTSYIAINNSEVDPDSPITADLMTKLRDNPIAISEGSSGAPKVQNAAIQNAAINRVKLSTGTNSGSYSTGAGGGNGTITMDGYSFFPAHNGTGTINIDGSSNADAPAVQWFNSGSGSGTVRWRYILA